MWDASKWVGGAAMAAVMLVGAAGAAYAREPAAAPGELIVRFRSSADAGDRLALRRGADTTLERTLPLPGVQLVEVERGQSVRRAQTELERSGEVLYAEPNFYRRAAVQPSDVYFGLQWSLENTGQDVLGIRGTPDADIDATEAWNLTTGSPAVTTAVVDTGVDYSHPDLQANMWTNLGEVGLGRETNGVDDDGNGRVDDWRGWDWVGADNDPADQNGHGTHVAGTIGAAGNNATGIAGVGWTGKLMPLRVLDADGNGTVAAVAQAYSYAAARGAQIVNASLGSDYYSATEELAIRNAPGTLFVVAAGNGGDDGVGDDNDAVPEYPCSYDVPNLVCVAASDQFDALTSFSNYGRSSVDLAAPGRRILSTWPQALTDPGYAPYRYLSGTSMATPHVAGAAALVAAADPGASVSDLRGAVLGGVDPLVALACKTATGGRLNAAGALSVAAGGAPSTEPPCQPASTSGPGAAPPPVAPPSAVPAPFVDRVAPVLSIRPLSGQRMRRVLSRGLTARVGCSEACALGARLRLRSRAAAAAPIAFRLPAAGSRRIVLKLTRRARRKLGGARLARLTLTVRASDAAGNTGTRAVRLLLRR